MSAEYLIRIARPDDYNRIAPVLDEWFGRRATGLPRLFLDHFWTTSFVAESADELAGFLVGFLSPAQPSVAYAHYICVRPDFRRTGLGRDLAQCFIEMARTSGRLEVRGETHESNALSIAFARSVGFAVSEPDDGRVAYRLVL